MGPRGGMRVTADWSSEPPVRRRHEVERDRLSRALEELDAALADLERRTWPRPGRSLGRLRRLRDDIRAALSLVRG